jgi:cellulose synthase/poly-beta-1,6-N-acetylglucosamine synthase-like glycosyltransferase
MELLFWLSLGVLGYIYAGYPLLIWMVAQVRPRPVQKGGQEPSVSIVIAAHNEAAAISSTIQNKLELDYQAGKVEIIVVSDGSTDGTEALARRFESQGVVVLRQEPRNGKAAALNMAVERARGDVLVFADANSIYDRCVLKRLVANFADPSVGYVTGTLAYVSSARSITADGCGLYMRYENFVRRNETAAGSIVGVNGGVDAMRRFLYLVMKPDDLPDFMLPLSVVQRGYRVVYEPAAMLAENSLGTPADEYRMRVRVALRTLWTAAEMRSLLNVRQYGFYALQFWSHKVLRYLAAPFILILYGSSIFLWRAGLFYELALVAQSLFVVLAVLGYCATRNALAGRLLGVPYYFTLVNCAAFHACMKFLRGKRPRVWTPRLG